MPVIGLGLHFLVAIFFAVHALRTGRNMYWLLILFSFPLLGSIVYFFVEYLPQSRLNRGINKAAGVAMKIFDPEREYREATAAFELAPTAQNKIRLATAALERGNAHEAVSHYNDALRGPFASDPELLYGLARALLADGAPGTASQTLDAVQKLTAARPDYRKEEVALLLARAHEANGQSDEARRAFEDALQKYNSVETRARYITFLAAHGAASDASRHLEDLRKASKHWTSHAKAVNREWITMAEASLKP